MIDRTSDTWLTLKRHIEDSIEGARSTLEKQRDPITAAELRGEIATYRDIIALGEPRVEETVEPTVDPTSTAVEANPHGDNSGY